MSTAVVSSLFTASPPSKDRSILYLMSSPLAPQNSASLSSPLQTSTSSSSAPLRMGSSSSSRLPSSIRASSSRVLKPGPLGLGGSNGSGIGMEANSIARLRRQQFRQKCQDAMARDRNRDRGRRIAQGRESRSSVSRSGSDNSDEEDKTLRSDDLVDSDLENETEMEYIRRVLAVDYKLMRSEMERSGEKEMGWLNADEVAWLEEEIKREEASGPSQRKSEMEPPADLSDEDEDLYAQYQHSQEMISSKGDEISEDENTWLDDEELQRAILGLESQTVAEDTQMSDT